MVTASIKREDYTTAINVREHNFMADEPLERAGQDKGPTPQEYLSAALVSCTLITLKMYIARKEWKIYNIEGQVQRSRNTEDGSSIFTLQIMVEDNLSDEQKEKLGKIARACPVHKVLEGSNTIKINVMSL